ncbi:MAG: glycosyltransferase family 4 protein [Oligoflexia bacterium]|nr:glycosyltransferase family 4 protein [Oligoflexia bacterium]
MRILFCSLHPLQRQLGASKVIIEVSEELSKLGWDCHLASDVEICPQINQLRGFKKLSIYQNALKDYVLKNQSKYDVIDYDHASLPFSRRLFKPEKLFVARSVLLTQHFDKIKIPRFEGIKSFFGLLFKGPYRYALLKKNISNANKTCSEADLINVSNDSDKKELILRGINEKKIIVIPFGLRDQDFEILKNNPEDIPINPKIAFIGTFDTRKGGAEFYKIVKNVSLKVPNIKFKLLGARYKSVGDVLSYFPTQLHQYLEIIPNYSPESLAQHLKDCTMGIFPSYVEGFGFGVLEMLAASLPVVAYNSPGPNMMLTNDLMVEPGNTQAMADKIIDLINNKERLLKFRLWSARRAQDFKWKEFAQLTAKFYKAHLENKT